MVVVNHHAIRCGLVLMFCFASFFASMNSSYAGKAFIGYCQPFGQDVTGGSACGVAFGEAICVYGSNLYQKGCSSGPDGARVDSYAGGPDGPPRPGFSSAYCTDPAESYVDSDCIKNPDDDPKYKNYCPVGNPIDPVTGAKLESFTDFAIGSASSLGLNRNYTSKLNSINTFFRQSRFGYGWRSNFDVAAYGASSGRVHIILPSWQYLVFSKNQDGSWSPNYIANSSWVVDPKGSPYVLNTVGNNLELSGDGTSIYVFDSSYKLVQIRQLDGYTQNISYNSNGLNDIVTDSFGRSLTFSYNRLGQATSVAASTGITINYTYDDKLDPAFRQNYLAGQPYDPAAGAFEPVLTSISYVGSTTASVSYAYEDAANKFALTGITDERGVRYATFSYGSNGFAVETKHAGGADKYQFAYDAQSGSTTVTSPLLKQSVYNVGFTNQGRRQLNGTAGLASAACPASSTSTIFDTNDYAASETDEEGRKTTYVRDIRGRPTSITRGAP